ncbi:MAG TPA: hypothetical protein VFI95_14410 [Terriglobales bacterium]|nr:hypothetical protein [Terriglobales bacterium]
MSAPTISNTHHEGVVFLALLGITLVAFAAVAGVVNRFRVWQGSLAKRMYERGQQDLRMGAPEAAIGDFRSALSFDHDNPGYLLSLAEGLESEKRFDEAEAYLLRVWESQPQDGTVNLQLARLAVHRDSPTDALRYYHNAIYGIWTSDPVQNRINARFELVEFLLGRHASTQAQSELIAMLPGLLPDSQLHAKVAALLMRVPDFQDALVQYREALRLDHNNKVAARGAGHAAFELGFYWTSLHYLEASNDKSQDAGSASMIPMARLVLATDPFLRNLSSQERHARMLRAFDAAEQRLHGCMQQHGESPVNQSTSGPGELQDLDLRGEQIKRRLRSQSLLNSSDFAESLMDFVFTTESSTQQECGEPTGVDKALLLIARNRETAGQ